MTESQAKNGQYHSSQGLRTLKTGKQRLLEAKESIPSSAKIFLSHSSKDSQYLLGPLSVLRKHGADVYLDKLDPSLPPKPSPETASKLRRVLKSCGTLVLLLSRNSKESKWVPWELGLGDGFHGHHRVALFPVTQDEKSIGLSGSEYLGIYPKIVYSDKNRIWIVKDPRDKKYWELENWCSQS